MSAYSNGFFLVCRAEVGVVVDDGLLLARLLQQLHHLLAQHGVQGVVRANQYDVVFLQAGEGHVEPLHRVVLVEEVFRIAVLVQEGERHGRLAVGQDIDVVRGDVVVAHEAQDDVAHAVVPGLADEVDRHARAAEGYDGVEDRASGHSRRGPVVAEDDVQQGFAYSDYFSHSCFGFSLPANICNFP